MRKVAFIYMFNQINGGYYENGSLAGIIENWVEVDEETFRKLQLYFTRTSYYATDEKKLVMVEWQEDMAPKLIKEVLEMADAFAKQEEKRKKDEAAKKAAKLQKKLQKEAESKRELLERLKKELGEK